jgi:hypothetical protein
MAGDREQGNREPLVKFYLAAMKVRSEQLEAA